MKDANSREWIVSVLSEISASERHFNNLQVRYRLMASSWLLGTFAGIGFVLAGKVQLKFVELPPEIFIIGITLASALGLYLLWNLDLMVYHRLLDAWFIEGYLFEKKHSWLPPVRDTMWTFLGKGVLNRAVGFYLVSEGVVLAIGIAALCFWMNKAHSEYTIIVLVLSLLVSSLVLYHMWRSTGNTRDLLNLRLNKEKNSCSNGVEPTSQSSAPHAEH